MVFVLSLLRSKELSVDASAYSAFTFDTFLSDSVLQAVEVVDME